MGLRRVFFHKTTILSNKSDFLSEETCPKINDDALVLQVIESYCVTTKGNNSCEIFFFPDENRLFTLSPLSLIYQWIWREYGLVTRRSFAVAIIGLIMITPRNSREITLPIRFGAERAPARVTRPPAGTTTTRVPLHGEWKWFPG